MAIELVVKQRRRAWSFAIQVALIATELIVKQFPIQVAQMAIELVTEQRRRAWPFPIQVALIATDLIVKQRWWASSLFIVVAYVTAQSVAATNLVILVIATELVVPRQLVTT
jgi:hypothetical protein